MNVNIKFYKLIILFFILLLFSFFACKTELKTDPCTVKEVIPGNWSMKDYDKSDSMFKSSNEYRKYKISKNLNLPDIRNSESNYFRIWYQSPDPQYGWVVDINPGKMRYKVLSFNVNYKKDVDSIYYRIYRADDEILEKVLLQDIEYNIRRYNIVNLRFPESLILIGGGNLFEVETMWEGKYNYELFQSTEFGYEGTKPLLLFVDFLIEKFNLPPLGTNPCIKDRKDPPLYE